jgi:Flp pilus assembly secretin CpaC
MTVLVRQRGKRLHSYAFAALLVAATAFASTTSAADNTLIVLLDQAKLVKMPDRVATIVIGNPLIADVSLQPGSMMVVTGKSYGLTNVMALDRSGAVLMEKSVRVLGQRDNVVVMYRGVERESYNCAPICEKSITLGDTGTFFDSMLAQGVNRTGLAQAGTTK